MASKSKFELTPLSIVLMFVIGILVVMLTVVVTGNQQNFQSDAARSAGGGPNYGNASIVMNGSTDNLAMNSKVSFTTVVPKLKGNEYPMVYVNCTQDGKTVYGQLDHPTTVFILGGGWSPWRDVGGDVVCKGILYVYGGQVQGHDIITFLAETPPFNATASY